MRGGPLRTKFILGIGVGPHHAKKKDEAEGRVSGRVRQEHCIGMRVYELAKKVGRESHELLSELERLGIKLRSASAGLDHDTAAQLLRAFGTQPSHDAFRKTVTSSGQEKQGTSGPRLAPNLKEDLPTPEKRVFLVKRKKSTEEITPSSGAPVAAGVSSDHMGPRVAQMHDSQPYADGQTAPAPISVKPSPSSSPLNQEGGFTQPLASISQPGEVLKSQGPVTTETIEPERPRTGKQRGQAIDASEEGRKELGKRVGKSPRPSRLPDEKPQLFRAGSAEWENLQNFRVRHRAERPRPANGSPAGPSTKPRRKVLKLSPGLTVKAFAEMVGQRPAEVLKKLMETGSMLTLNQPIPQDAAVLLAEAFGVLAERNVVKEGDDLLVEFLGSAGNHTRVARPPVITIMGHVDHGKTSLLDAIRQTRLTEQEAGGITQRIGAYTVRVGDIPVTFIDTPGHEAFTAMRARGAKATDIVVLVVAADDGVMPQTIEAIHHAAAAQVPIIVAINKIDKPEANAERVKYALAEQGLIPEAWGGKTIIVEVSALHKRGLDTLLEMILLQAEIMELTASPSRPALGVVLEAKLDRHRGPVATILVQNGTLRVGDAFVVGTFSGRVRAMISDTGVQLLMAGPSTPVEVLGLPEVPAPGDQFVVVKDEGVAREIAEGRVARQRSAEQEARVPRYTLEDLSSRMKEQGTKELSLLIKADLRGSAEALSEAIRKLSTGAVRVRILYQGVGGITESDVLLAAASQAVIIGFAVRPEPKATALAEREGVEIRLYTIIYEAVADIKATMEGLLEPMWKERTLGHAVVRQIFTVPKVGVVTGCYVTDGVITRANTRVRVIRDQVTIHEGTIGSLRRFKDDVREVQQGYDCGITIENSSDLKVGDVLEAFVLDRELVRL